MGYILSTYMTMTDAKHVQTEEEHVAMFNDLRVLMPEDDQGSAE